MRYLGSHIVFLLSATCLSLFFTVPCAAQSGSAREQEESGEKNKEDAESQKQELKKKELWEVIVSFPGDVLYFPLYLLFEGTKKTVEFADESNIAAKTVDLLTADDGSWAITPAYSSRTGAGIKYYRKLSPDSDIRFTSKLAAGLRRRQGYQVGLEGISFSNGSINAVISAGYYLLSDERYFGRSPVNGKEEESNYAHEQSSLTVEVSSGLNENTTLYADLSLEHNNILAGKNSKIPSTTDVYGTKPLPGMETEVKLARFTFGITRDLRNDPGRTTSGSVGKLQLSIANDIGAETYGFWQINFDVRRYIHLFYNRVLVVRVGGAITEPLLDRKIPFYYLSELGRQETIRGYTRGRFRGNDMALASVEYRYPVSRSIDSFLFIDAGQTAENIVKDFSVRDANLGYGMGFNVFGKESIAFQFIAGHSKDGFRLYFKLDQDF